jgi:ABC-type cobalamin/Fe3+-siderophores transport system ATPase subunit
MQGELVAIIGRIGSGKSSFLNVLLMEIPLYSGTYNIQGKIASEGCINHNQRRPPNPSCLCWARTIHIPWYNSKEHSFRKAISLVAVYASYPCFQSLTRSKHHDQWRLDPYRRTRNKPVRRAESQAKFSKSTISNGWPVHFWWPFISSRR